MGLLVAVLASDSALRKALMAQLSGWPEFEVVDDNEHKRAAVVLAPARDCPPAHCEALVSDGFAVVILAPIWREHERANYEAAGASGYLAMNLDLPVLALAISAAGERRGQQGASPAPGSAA